MTHDALDALARDYWEAVLAEEPLFATQIGDHRYDDRLRDPSPEGRAAWLARLEELAAREAALGASEPDPVARVTRSALREALRGDIAHLRTGVDEWSVDPLEGPQVEFENVEAYQPVATAADGEALVARWRAMGPYVDATTANLRRTLADGRVAARAPVVKSIAELDQVAATPDADLALLAPARADHPDWVAADLSSFRDEVAAAVRDVVRPAFARLRAVLHDEILPAARPDDRPGIVHVPGGAAAYHDLIRYHTSLDLPAEELHATGLEEITRIDAEFVALGARVLGTRDLDETLARLRDDPALHFATREEIVAVAEASLARAAAALPATFGILPQAPCAVVPMGPHEEEHSTIAYYRQPALDGSRPGQYYVNTSAPATRPRYEAEALAFHESIPGHHLQIAIGQELTGIPEFRRHLGPTAFFEGWGLYTERLSDEMGLYSGDLDLFGVLSFDAWRACRLVVDTGMHALGWSRSSAIDFMRAHTALGANNIANEVDRYIVWPGQALAYKTGQLEILRLRDEAHAAAGTAFDIRAFHDAVLDGGALPLATLREVVTERFSRALD
ncbi:MAG: DUF885 domain-containing protein [Chloroflexi bacterium]|nr:DUF885 domain-containing protein [Chloroflexota bacterium]